MDASVRYAPGWPGIAARWTSSAKSAVGTALNARSRVWFTLSHGIFNEIYYPRIDRACVRDLGLIVSDAHGFLSEEKRDTETLVRWLAPGVPGFRVTNSCREGRYRIEKTILSDPGREAVLQLTRFVPLQGGLGDYRLYVLLAPHLDNHGSGNTAWVGAFKGEPMLFAQRGACALALACSVPWGGRSVGFVGHSDGWQDLSVHREMSWQYDRAENGNVALTAEIELPPEPGEFLLVLGFGSDAAEAGNRARAALQDGFESAQSAYLSQWKEWQSKLLPLDRPDAGRDLYRASTAVLRVHESKAFAGGFIASVSIPWGFSKGDDDLGGYHLAWPRDLVESAGGLLAVGAHHAGRRVLRYLQAIQEADGHWAQNLWLDGTPYLNGVQMDETALPILLVELARREKALSAEDEARFWPMVKKAAGYLVCNGPVSPEDRWEEDPGYSPFTVAAEIAALLAAADLAEQFGEGGIATYLRETADVWYFSLDRWLYVTGSDWCRRFEVDGYYVRLAPVSDREGPARFRETVTVKNVPSKQARHFAEHLVSPDALALVRFGLRCAEDPRMRNTVKVIDGLLKMDTASGPLWHRYNGDGYGEHADGGPFDGTGIGRVWPLLTGERAHFELAAGRDGEARRLLETMESSAGAEGLLPEQCWDAADMPERELFFGRPSGSAMPLAWAHAEYLKLLRSLRDGRVFDMPPQTVHRYLRQRTESRRLVWRFNHKIRTIPAGLLLRVESAAPARVRWSADDWEHWAEVETRDSGVGMQWADLDPGEHAGERTIRFTFYWLESRRWEGADFAVRIVPRQPDEP